MTPSEHYLRGVPTGGASNPEQAQLIGDALKIHYFPTTTSKHSTCADGSPSAMYSNQAALDRDPRRHVFFVMGGGACLSDEDCQDVMHDEPYKLSSDSWPTSVRGQTILSSNAELNPIAHNYTHWILPYCSQDAFLGAGSTDTNGLVRAGSVHLTQALEYWLEQIALPPEEVIFVGTSAGALGVLNHLETILAAGRSAGASKTRIILDSPPLSIEDEEATPSTLSEYVVSHVNSTVHPMCLQVDEGGRPCCLSTHCMLRHDPFITKWSSEVGDEQLLLINSIYDPYETSKKVSSKGSLLGDYVRMALEVEHSGGERQGAIVETVNSLNARTRGAGTPKLAWVYTSCVMHGFLVHSTFDRETIDCDSGEMECRGDDTIGMRINDWLGASTDALVPRLILWNAPELWQTECVRGQSIRSVISDFVFDQSDDVTSGEEVFATSFGDTCVGPNCAESSTISPCHQFLEIEQSFQPLPPLMKWPLFLTFVVGSCVAFLLRFKPYLFVKPRKQQDDDKKTGDSNPLGVVGLSVRHGKKWLLQDVSFSLPPGEVTALCGRSGAG